MIRKMGILLTNGDSFTYGDELPGSRRADENGKILEGKHHHLTFTHKLAEKLGVDYVNLAHNGSSNQKIFRRTTTFFQQSSKEVDYLVLTWSSWGRIEVVTDFHPNEDKSMYMLQETNMNQIIPDHYSRALAFGLRHWDIRDDEKLDWNPEDEKRIVRIACDWVNHVYTMFTPILHHLNYMCIMQDMCDAKGIKLIQGMIHPDLWSNLKRCLMQKDRYPHWAHEVLFYLEYLRPECRVGLGHYQDMTSMARENDDFFIYPKGHPCEGTHSAYADQLYDIFQGLENATD